MKSNMTNKQMEARRAADRAYAKKWYEANRLYKRTYQRFYRRCTSHKLNLEQRGAANTALDEIIRDRKDQIAFGNWINERTGEVYKGVKGTR